MQAVVKQKAMLRVAQSLANLQLHQAKINHEPITMKTVKVAALKKAKASKRLQIDPLLFCTRESACASTSTLLSTNMEESSCNSSYGLTLSTKYDSNEQKSKGHYHRVQNSCDVANFTNQARKAIDNAMGSYMVNKLDHLDDSRNPKTCRSSDKLHQQPLLFRRNAVKVKGNKDRVVSAVDAPILPYEYDRNRMKNERLQRKSMKRVITQHELVSKKCAE